MSIIIALTVFIAVIPSTPSSTAALATSRILSVFGESFAKTGFPVADLTALTTLATSSGVVPHLRSDSLDVRTAQVQLIAREVLAVERLDDLGEFGGSPAEYRDDDGGGTALQ